MKDNDIRIVNLPVKVVCNQTKDGFMMHVWDGQSFNYNGEESQYVGNATSVEGRFEIDTAKSMEEVIALLSEARDQLAMCTLIDKSGQCDRLVNFIDERMSWK